MELSIVEPKVELLTPISHLVDYEKLIELAGRNCYKSEENITDFSAQKFITGTIIKNGHLSVIEHCGVMYRIICSRATSHQIVRHRIGSHYSQESMRYVDYGRRGYQIIIPPSIQQNPEMSEQFKESCVRDYQMYTKFRNEGIKPEDARFLLPHASKTELVMSCNLRQWRHVIEERALNNHAQWEIQGIMRDILYELSHYLPSFFNDLKDKLEAIIKPQMPEV